MASRLNDSASFVFTEQPAVPAGEAACPHPGGLEHDALERHVVATSAHLQRRVEVPPSLVELGSAEVRSAQREVPDEPDQRFIFAVAAGEQRLAEFDRGIDLDDRAVVDRQSPRRAEKQLAVLGDVAELTHPVEQLGKTWSGIAGADEEEPAELIEDFQFAAPSAADRPRCRR